MYGLCWTGVTSTSAASRTLRDFRQPTSTVPRLERAGQDAVDLPDCRAGLTTPVIVTMLSRSWK